MKKKEYDKLEEKKSDSLPGRLKRTAQMYYPEKIKPPKPKDPLELQLWKLDNKLGILQKEFRDLEKDFTLHKHDE